MCIALPRQIAAVIDAARAEVMVTDGSGPAAVGEAVSAALVCGPDGTVAALVGRWALIHAGFVLSLIDEADARSRLQVFAALDGADTPIDLQDFYDALPHPGQAPSRTHTAPPGPPSHPGDATDGAPTLGPKETIGGRIPPQIT